MSEQVCTKGTGRPHGVTEHGVEGHPHLHNPLASYCAKNGPGEPSCSLAICRECVREQVQRLKDGFMGRVRRQQEADDA